MLCFCTFQEIDMGLFYKKKKIAEFDKKYIYKITIAEKYLKNNTI
jgi:hypothetical protein